MQQILVTVGLLHQVVITNPYYMLRLTRTANYEINEFDCLDRFSQLDRHLDW